MAKTNAVIRTGLAAALTAALLATVPASAQDAQKKAAPANPVGAGWTGTVNSAAGTSGQSFDEKQTNAIKTVSGYFNTLKNLKGRFVQTDPDGKTSKGRVFVKKPGRFRFDYAPPSKKVIVSDGRYLAIQDLDLGNEDVYELDNTPFRLLLQPDVDLLRDAQILEIGETADTIRLSMQDKASDANGRIALTLSKAPALALKEWVTTDAQGQNTRIELSELDDKEELESKLFQRENLILRKLQ